MNEYVQEISVEQAQRVAEKEVRIALKLFMEIPSIPVLSEEYEEAECCWCFFRNKKIECLFPSEQIFLWNYAYAVSKKGEFMAIPDFSNEPEKLKEYLRQVSNHFKKRGL